MTERKASKEHPKPNRPEAPFHFMNFNKFYCANVCSWLVDWWTNAKLCWQLIMHAWFGCFLSTFFYWVIYGQVAISNKMCASLIMVEFIGKDRKKLLTLIRHFYYVFKGQPEGSSPIESTLLFIQSKNRLWTSQNATACVLNYPERARMCTMFLNILLSLHIECIAIFLFVHYSPANYWDIFYHSL